MHDRDINYLLKKYETKDVNEIWSTEHETQYKRNQRTKKRLLILDGIINERKTISRGTFRFTEMQKSRAHYIIRNFDFSGRNSEKKIVVMIMVYVKLEQNPTQKLKEFYPILNDYDISIQTFVRFLITLNKFHIDKIPVN
jgi:hypothetical protein